MSGESIQAGLEFEQFVRDLVPVLLPGATVASRLRDDTGIDVVALVGGRTAALIETRSYTPSTEARLRRVLDAFREASAGGARDGSPRLILAIPGVLSPDRLHALQTAQVEVWDGVALAKAARLAGIEPPPGIVLATESGQEPVGKRQLSSALRSIPTGVNSWSAYQQFCSEVLEFLFHPPLNRPLYENSTSNRLSRRDIILANYAENGFWAFLRKNYRADFIVVDAKNYGKAIGKDQVLQLANYLSHHGAGLFGIVLTRKGADKGAQWTMREHWVLHNKMIIVLNDEDVRQMLAAKASGGDPSDVIKQKIEDFRLGL